MFFVGNGASNASQLSRNKLQEEGGTGGMFNRSIIQYFFTTKLSYEIVEEFFIRYTDFVLLNIFIEFVDFKKKHYKICTVQHSHIHAFRNRNNSTSV